MTERQGSAHHSTFSLPPYIALLVKCHTVNLGINIANQFIPSRHHRLVSQGNQEQRVAAAIYRARAISRVFYKLALRTSGFAMHGQWDSVKTLT